MIATLQRKPLGQLLLSKGLLKQDQLERALDEQKRSNHQKLLGEILVPIHSRIASGLRQLAVQLRRLEQLRVEHRRHRSSRRPQTLRFRADPVRSRRFAAERALPSDSWRSRLVALIELILFVVLISALFAGAIAAAAIRIGHLGT